MPSSSVISSAVSAPDGRRGARVLALCQALYTSAVSIDLKLTGLVGYTLATDKALATLPFSLITVLADHRRCRVDHHLRVIPDRAHRTSRRLPDRRGSGCAGRLDFGVGHFPSRFLGV